MMQMNTPSLNFSLEAKLGSKESNESLESYASSLLALLVYAVIERKLESFVKDLSPIFDKWGLDLANSAKRDFETSINKRASGSPLCPDWVAGMRTTSGRCPNCLEVHI